MGYLGKQNYLLTNRAVDLPHNYIGLDNPAIDVNPPVLNMTWLNTTSGEIFVCLNNSIGNNVWYSPGYGYIYNPSYYDPFIGESTVLLPFDGVDGGTTFTDYGTDPLGFTIVGTPHTSTDESISYGSSIYFDGDGDYLSVNDVSKLNLSSFEDFCIDFWAYTLGWSADNINTIITRRMNGTGGWEIYLRSTGFTFAYWDNAGEYEGVTISTTLPLNGWSHFCVTYDSSIMVFKIYINGQLALSALKNGHSIGNGALDASLGGTSAFTTRNHYGYISDFRIIIGTRRFFGDFIPPTNARYLSAI